MRDGEIMNATENATKAGLEPNLPTMSRTGICLASCLCQLFFTGAVVWLADGVLLIMAILLTPLSLYLILQSRQTRNDSGGMLARLAATHGKQIDLRQVETGQAQQSEAGRLFSELNERLRAVVLDMQNNSLRTALASANSRLLAEKAAKDAGRQQQVSELIFHASEQTTTALHDISSRATDISAVTTRNLDLARESKQQMGEARQNMLLVSDATATRADEIAACEASSASTSTRWRRPTERSRIRASGSIARPKRC